MESSIEIILNSCVGLSGFECSLIALITSRLMRDSRGEDTEGIGDALVTTSLSLLGFKEEETDLFL